MNVYAVRNESGELWARYCYEAMAAVVAARMTNEGAGRVYTVHAEIEIPGEVVSYATVAA